MDDHAVADLFRTWGLPPPDAVRRAAGGTNNVVRIVDAGGSSYVVRGYQNLSPERVAAEHRLLMAVAGTGLPFAVPTPIPAADGVTHVRTPSGVMAVFSYLPGRPPDRTSLAEVERAGTALADLDLALAGLAPELAPVDWRCPLAAIHPAVPDVDELGRQLAAALPGDPGAEWLRTTAGPADQAYALLHGSLPVQIVHGDVALSNLLVDDHGVPTAMLDFEVAGLDVAVNDLVAAVFQSTRGWWTPGCADASNAFCRGFGRRHHPHTGRTGRVRRPAPPAGARVGGVAGRSLAPRAGEPRRGAGPPRRRRPARTLARSARGCSRGRPRDALSYVG